jgi:Uma2 family endonuclease
MIKTINKKQLQEKHFDERLTEKINGVIYFMASPNTRHNHVSRNLAGLFWNFLRGKECKSFSQLDIMLDENNTFVPDLSVICDRTKLTDQNYQGAPSLVVEILSPATMKNDKGIKFDVYEKSGVQEYWIVDTNNKAIEQYVLIDGRLRLIELPVYSNSKNDPNYEVTFRCKIFADLEIKLSEVFESI